MCLMCFLLPSRYLATSLHVGLKLIDLFTEVVRVRVRQELLQKKYKKMVNTLQDVLKNEGLHGLYGGLKAQLARQALNMSILMGVYEAVIYQYKKYD